MLLHLWMRLQWKHIIPLAVVLGLFLFPTAAAAHASLLSTEPAANARIEQAPEQVKLQFNQKLQAVTADSLAVSGPGGEDAIGGAVAVSEDGKEIAVPLQADLADGEYTVAYQVLSLDGHAVKGTFTFTVNGPGAAIDDTQQTGESNSGAGEPVNPPAVDYSQREPIIAADEQVALPGKAALLSGISTGDYAMAVFYMFYLAMLGLALWGVFLRGRSEEQLRLHRHWMLQMQRLYFLIVILVMVEWVHRIAGFEDWSAIQTLLLQTNTGVAWLVLLALSIIGMFVLGYSKTADALWVIAAIAAKTQIGHASAADSHLLAALLSGVHLAAAAVWLGGLLLIVLLWRRYRYEAEKLLPTYSGAALATFLLLLFTGIMSSALYLPDLGYILETRWGLVLIAKLAVVALVGFVVTIIRRRFRATGVMRLGAWLKLDLAFLLLAAALAGILSSSEPIPPNKPLHWHVMGDDVHMTAEISPMSQGHNEYGVTVWLPEGDGAPRLVELELQPVRTGEEGDVAAIPLAQVEGDTDIMFLGFETYFYRASGVELSEPGWWRITVKVTDGAGQRWEYRNKVKIY